MKTRGRSAPRILSANEVEAIMHTITPIDQIPYNDRERMLRPYTFNHPTWKLKVGPDERR